MTALSALAPETRPGAAGQRGCGVWGPLAVRYRADGLSGHTAGIGTTLTATLFSGGHAALPHIGDSRAFRLPGAKSARAPRTTRSANLVATSACSRRCSHGTWTAAQLARRLGVSRETVRRLAIAGALPHTVVCQGARKTTRRYPRRFAEEFAASGLEVADLAAFAAAWRARVTAPAR